VDFHKQKERKNPIQLLGRKAFVLSYSIYGITQIPPWRERSNPSPAAEIGKGAERYTLLFHTKCMIRTSAGHIGLYYPLDDLFNLFNSIVQFWNILFSLLNLFKL